MLNGLSQEQAYRNRISFSVEEAAKIWGYNPRTVWKRIRSGQLAAARIGTRILLPRIELEKLTGPLSPLPVDQGPALLSVLSKDCGISDRFLRELISTGALSIESRVRPIKIDRQHIVDWLSSHTDTSGARVRPDLAMGVKQRNRQRRKAATTERSAP